MLFNFDLLIEIIEVIIIIPSRNAKQYYKKFAFPSVNVIV